MTEALWTAAELAAATGGSARGDWSVAGVAINSRTVQQGELFIALRGPQHDGHDFVAAALAKRAAGLVDHIPAGIPADARLLLVEDTMAALTALGRAARVRSHARIAAITGSVGKTGTKEALSLVLKRQAATHASAASHNNHWGVPLSLAREPRATVYGVYELGMNAPGEILALARLVRPQVAMITRVAPAHLGFFPSVEAIAAAKGEIFGGLEPGGVAVLNLDDPHTPQLVQDRQSRRLRARDRLRQLPPAPPSASRMPGSMRTAARSWSASMAPSLPSGSGPPGGIGSATAWACSPASKHSAPIRSPRRRHWSISGRPRAAAGATGWTGPAARSP